MSEKENRSIEETVEELRKQIQEITEEAKVAADQEEEISQADEIKNDAADFLRRLIEMMKNTSRDVAESEQFKATCAFVQEKSKQIVMEVKNRIHDLKEDPDLQKNVNDAKSACLEAYNKVAERVSGDIEKIKQNEEWMDRLNKVKDETCRITRQSVEVIKDGIDDFTSKPKVNEAIEKTKDVTIEVAEKAVDSLKAWLRPENNPENETEQTAERSGDEDETRNDL